jgi:N-acetylneuraminic acid mutarotase
MKKQLLLYFIITMIFWTIGKVVYSQNNSWVIKTDMPTARMFLSVCTANGKIYAIGGVKYVAQHIVLSTVEQYDPSTDSWITKTDLPQPLHACAISSIGNNIYVFGGAVSWFGSVTSTLYAYDVVDDKWSTKTSMPTSRCAAAACVVDGKIYVIGGAGSGNIPAMDVLEVYDPNTNLWTIKTKMPTPRSGLTASVVDGKIYAIGGTQTPPWVALNVVEVYDPSSDTWTSKSPLIQAKWAHCAEVINGKIYIIGGASSVGGEDIFFSTVEEYDPVNDIWSSKTSMPQINAAMGSSVYDGKIYVIGGGFIDLDNSIEVNSLVYQYDPSLDVTAVDDNKNIGPTEYALYQNYPNPFNPSTKIGYKIPRESFVIIKLYDLLGQEIKTLVNENKQAGNYTYSFNASNLPSGVYLYRIVAESFSQTKKMILLK